MCMLFFQQTVYERSTKIEKVLLDDDREAKEIKHGFLGLSDVTTKRDIYCLPIPLPNDMN